MNVRLRVNFSGGKLCVEVNNRFYEYVPERDNGVLDVSEADIDKLLEMTYEGGCRCSNCGTVTRLHYFERI